MRRFTKLALAAAAVAAMAAPAAAQGLRFDLDIGPRYEPAPRYYYEAPGYYYAPPGSTYGPNYQSDCYANSLNGRVCID